MTPQEQVELLSAWMEPKPEEDVCSDYAGHSRRGYWWRSYEKGWVTRFDFCRSRDAMALVELELERRGLDTAYTRALSAMVPPTVWDMTCAPASVRAAAAVEVVSQAKGIEQ